MSAGTAVSARLRERAARAPRELALAGCGGMQTPARTWAELDRATSCLADTITRLADRPARCVLLAAADNSLGSIISLVAMLRSSLPTAVLAKAAPEAEVAALRDLLLRSGHDVVQLDGNRAVITRSGVPPRIPLPPESLLLTTGGSAGKPKVVIDHRMRTVARLPRGARPSSIMNWRQGQRQMVIGPLNHAAALSFFLEGLCDGNPLVVPAIFDPAEVLAAIADRKVEWLSLTPYHLRHLVTAARRAGTGLASVRGLAHLSAPCPHWLKREAIDLFGADRVFELYGCTEGIGVTVASGEEWLLRPGTVGRGFFTQIRIAGPAGQCLPPGRQGEVLMRSGHTAGPRYLTGSAGPATTLDGFASVGDQGWLDRDSFLYLAPRQLTRVQVGGETVDPAEVESVLLQLPAVLDAAVLGVPDQRLGESLVALVVPAGDADASGLRRHLRQRMARHKVPRVLQFVERLPRTEAGKLDRRELASFAAAHGVPAAVPPRPVPSPDVS